MPDLAEDEMHALIRRFEMDIRYDCHSLTARYSRSEARRKIIAAGASAVKQLEKYMNGLPDSHAAEYSALDEDVKKAFETLLQTISPKPAVSPSIRTGLPSVTQIGGLSR